MKSQYSIVCILLAACFLINGCNYDFSLTATPSRKIEIKLIGDWVASDAGNKKPDLLHVRQFDDFTFVVSMDNEIYRAFHSDFADTPFLSVQDLNAGNRKYIYFTWQLSADATRLTLKGIRTDLIPEATKTAAEIQSLIKQNLKSPRLFQDELQFTRMKVVSR